MNRIDRISAILIQLQSKRIVKGQDIADRFSISLRTAYRDIKTLEEAGVPISSEAGIGYSIMEGYRLPPVMFTKDEALAFLTAEKLIGKFTDSTTFKLYQDALFKIKAVLKSDEKEHLEKMEASIEVIGNPYVLSASKKEDYFHIILNAISQKTVVSIDYFANHSQEHTSRKIEPVGIYYLSNHWYLIAFCWLRNDYRSFKVERIKKVKITDQPYRKKHPPLKSFLDEITKQKENLHTVIMNVDKEIMKFFGDQKFYNGFVSEREIKGKIEMTFLTCSLEGFARWFMMFGDQAEIISPKELKDNIRIISSKILKKVK